MRPLPATLASTKSAYIRMRVRAALDAGGRLPPLPRCTLDAVTIKFDATTATEIDLLAQKEKVPAGEIVGRLLEASRYTEPAVIPVPKRSRASRNSSFRPEQTLILDGLRPALEDNRIAFCEGGTGVGKSRVIAVAAGEILAAGEHRRVIISAPSIQNLMHLLAEWETAVDTPEFEIPRGLTVAVVLGRSQFLDLASIEELIADSPTGSYPKTVSWLKDGAPAGLTPETRQLLIRHPTITGLAADLLEVDPSFPIDRCLLTDRSDQISSASYDALRASAQDADLIFCSHAMLATDTLTRVVMKAEILPDRDTLFIDEAHLYEAEQAKIATRDLAFSSLRSLLRHQPWSEIRARATADRALESCTEAFKALQTLKKDIVLPYDLSERRTQMQWLAIAEKLVSFRQSLDSLNAVLKKTRDKDKWKRTTAVFKDAVDVLGSATTHLRRSDLCRVSFSSERRWPSLQIGPQNVSGLLRRLWDSTRAAGLLSATLYLPTANGSSPNYLKMTLSIPEDRIALIPPVQPPWLRTPHVFRPRTRNPRLSPPSGADLTPEAIETWLRNLLPAFDYAADTAAGGTLILMSGYDRADVLNGVLAPRLGSRLILQERVRAPASACKAKFIAASRAGLRPIWIATGSAWTGIDIRDETIPDAEAHRDLLLTDLIIPNLPFGTTRTTTHNYRVDHLGRNPDTLETALKFRQGLGRLIRRAGLTDRRIFVLDERLADPRKKFITDSMSKILDDYPDSTPLESLFEPSRKTA